MIFEVRVPISPVEHFFRRIDYLHRSLKACGGETAKARVVVSVGDDSEPFDITAAQPWSRDRISWRWVDREAFRRRSYDATGFDRFLAQSDADLVLLADADVIFLSDIDDVLDELSRRPAVAGVMAHAAPTTLMPDWQQLFARAGVCEPLDFHQFSGWRSVTNDPRQRFAPAYYNYGAVFVPGRWMPVLADSLLGFEEFAEKLGYGFFAAQIALTLAIYKLGLRHLILEPRYNFPNDVAFEKALPNDMADIRILHYLRGRSREEAFASDEALTAFIARRDLTGSNELLRSRLEYLQTL